MRRHAATAAANLARRVCPRRPLRSTANREPALPPVTPRALCAAAAAACDPRIETTAAELRMELPTATTLLHASRHHAAAAAAAPRARRHRRRRSLPCRRAALHRCRELRLYPTGR